MKRTLTDLLNKSRTSKFFKHIERKNKMKYVIMACHFGGTEREMPFIFPDMIVHDHMKTYATHLLNSYKATHIECVSAGFCNFIMDEVNCSGESESIGVKSRGERDNILIQGFNYSHGVDSLMNSEMLKILREQGKKCDEI